MLLMLMLFCGCCQVCVVDPGADSGVSADSAESVGEVVIRGPTLFEGYWNRQHDTQEAFTTDGWFRTGGR